MGRRGGIIRYGFRWNAELREETLLKKYVPNYRINLVDAGNIGSPERFHSDLQQIFGVLKYRSEKEKLQSYMKENRAYFENVDVDTYQAMREFLHSERQLKSVVKAKGKEERINMCKALEDIYNDGVERGREEGREEGIEVLIETCRDLGVSREDTVSQLMTRFVLEQDAALKCVEQYW